MILLASALAAGRSDGDDAARRGAWAEALAAWDRCAADAEDRDARYCASRAEAIRPQAADRFEGWAILEDVRRQYRTLGSDAALARIEAALAAHPDSPAAPAMRVWLVNERERRGDADAAAALRDAVRADPRASAQDLAFVADRTADDALARHRRTGAGVGATLAALFLVRAAVGPGALRWRSAGVALALLGGFPTVFAALYDDGLADGFAAAGLVVGGAVLLAGRAPVWLAVPGFLGGLFTVGWGFGWLPSLGF